MDNQFEKFLIYDNFELAFLRLKTTQRNLYKSLYYPELKIFENFLLQNINTLIEQIKNKTYTPEKAHKIFIPKKNNLVRPLSILTFRDLLVFQALTNVIAEVAYDKISTKYGIIIFGNIINISTSNRKNRQFFFKSWKKNWKNFAKKSKKYYSEGYKYLSEFDIASFFDTIDHNILSQILENEYSIEKEILNFLTECLEKWTIDFNHRSFKAKHGIPQGPVSSPFLADLYLSYLDDEITNKKSLDIKYLRYVDDIRIFSKDAKTSQKAVATLDLLSRDLGLIPQGAKIFIKKITEIDKELKIQNNKFSTITKEYKKGEKRLKAKTHKQLKKRFIDCFEEDDTKRKEEYLDKTIISFSLFKLNKDDEIKELIINNYAKILTHFEGMLFYLSKFYVENNGKIEVSVKEFLNKLLNDDDILFHHLNALILKYFPGLPFNENVFEKYIINKNRNWLVRYYMVDWLYKNEKTELFELLFTKNDENPFILRKINDYKFILSNDDTFKKLFTEKLLEDNYDLTALHGLYLSFRNLNLFFRLKDSSNYNSYVRAILGGKIDDFILKILKKEYGISNPDTFFNRNIWDKDDEYSELVEAFYAYENFRRTQPSIALLNLNNFNNLCFNKICKRLNIKRISKEYDVNLNANIIQDIFPKVNRYWTEINTKRNQKSEAHPYDKYGKIRIKITQKELDELHKKEIDTLDEICKYRNY